MATWKKLITSGSDAELRSVTASFKGDGTGITGVVASASPAGTGSSIQFHLNGSTTGSTNFTYNEATAQLVITGSASITGTTSGSFIGNGAGLTGIAVTPAGTGSAIQFKLGSAPTGSSKLTFNEGTSTLQVVGNVTASSYSGSGDGLFNIAAAGTGSAIQFNLGGRITGSSFLVFNEATDMLQVVGSVASNNISAAHATLTNVTGSMQFQTYKETRVTAAISANTLTLNLTSGSYFEVPLNADITTMNINQAQPSASAQGFVLQFTADGTPRSVTWAASIKWPSATAPTLTSTNGKIDVFGFSSVDGGTSWIGYVAGQNY